MTLVMPMGSWDTVNTLCFNRKVLFLGVNDGYDVLSVAQVSKIVVACPVTNGPDRARELSLADTVIQSAQAGGLDANVLVTTSPYTGIVAGYGYGGFDVAIVNPQLLGEDAPGELIANVAACAHTVIVIEPESRNLWDVVTAAVADRRLMCTGDGSIIVARPMPTEPTIRQD